jgi:gliding-associated putative ABC transporter substrate-binding component GldG
MKIQQKILVSFLVIVLVNIISSFYSYDLDLTQDKRYTLSKSSKNILNKIDDILTIKVYLDGDLPTGFQMLNSSINNFLTNCRKNNSFIEFEFINPNDNNESKRKEIYNQLQSQGLFPTDLTIKKTNETARKIIFPGAIMYYKDKREAINLLENNFSISPQKNINNSIENIEFHIISAISKITVNKKENIAFLTGNGELNSNQTFDITSSVNNDNNNLNYYYNVEEFNIKEFEYDSIKNEPNISLQLRNLNRYKLLIIAKPTIPFNKLDKFLIDQYIMNGGKVLFLIDGAIASLDSLNNKDGYFIATKNNLNLDDQLFKYGIRVNSNLVQDLRSTEIPVVTGYSNNRPLQELFKWPYYPLVSSGNIHPISKNIDGIKCNFISSIDTLKNNISKTILLESSKNSRFVQTPSKISLGIIENPPPIESYNKGKLPLAVLLSGKFTSVFKDRIIPKTTDIKFKKNSDSTSIIVIADGDLIANETNKNGNIYPLGYDKFINYTFEGNKKFIINAIQFLTDNNGLINLRSKNIKLRLLNNDLIANYRILIIILNIFLPLILFLILIYSTNKILRVKIN